MYWSETNDWIRWGYVVLQIYKQLVQTDRVLLGFTELLCFKKLKQNLRYCYLVIQIIRQQLFWRNQTDYFYKKLTSSRHLKKHVSCNLDTWSRQAPKINWIWSSAIPSLVLTYWILRHPGFRGSFFPRNYKNLLASVACYLSYKVFYLNKYWRTNRHSPGLVEVVTAKGKS